MRCLLIELNAGLYSATINKAALEQLQGRAIDTVSIVRLYRMPTMIRRRLHLLTQVRHELIHPAHRPGGERSNTPAYLTTLRKQRLLQSTGKLSDYIWIEQLQSHKLFRWAFETMALTVEVLVNSHTVTGFAAAALRESWFSFRK